MNKPSSTIDQLLGDLHQQKRQAEAAADGHYHAQCNIAKALLADAITLEDVQRY